MTLQTPTMHTRQKCLVTILLLIMTLIPASATYTNAAILTVERVSIASDGQQANDNGEGEAIGISNNGRFVTFESYADNLVVGDTNNSGDIFVHDRETGITSRISVNNDGVEGNSYSQHPSISSDGRFVAFVSDADNLVVGDTNNRRDIFVHDRETGITSRISVNNDGVEGNSYSDYPSISGNGRFVTFLSRSNNLVSDDTNDKGDIFVHDRQTETTVRVSVDSQGNEANGQSRLSAVSADGRFVTYDSEASNLVTNDTNNQSDVFLHDQETGETIRISVADNGIEGNDRSDQPALSANGSFVSFRSFATNLVTNDSNDAGDIFVYERETGSITRVSINSDGVEGNEGSNYPSINESGRFVTFSSGATNLTPNDLLDKGDIFAHDRQTGTTTRVSVTSNLSEANSVSWHSAISSDGTTIAFDSGASNLVPQDSNGSPDVFVVTQLLAEQAHYQYLPTLFTKPAPPTVDIKRVSINNDGNESDGSSNNAALSSDSRYVAFASAATDLVNGDTNGENDIFVHDSQTGKTKRVSVDSQGNQAEGYRGSELPDINANGRFITFASTASNLVPEDTNGTTDIFVHDQQTSQTTRISVNSDGNQGHDDSAAPAISADGRFVIFSSWADNLVSNDHNSYNDIFVHDQITGETTRVSISHDGGDSNSASFFPDISTDGRFVTFSSYASNLVPNDVNSVSNIFVHDRQTGETTLVSVAGSSEPANDDSYLPSISGNGRFVTFESFATNLVANDTNSALDIFVHDRQTGETRRVSVHTNGSQANGSSHHPVISQNGRFITYESEASNLVEGDTNFQADIFVYDLETATTTRVSQTNNGKQANRPGGHPAISGDGTYIAFTSYATNLIADDSNAQPDIFVVKHLK